MAMFLRWDSSMPRMPRLIVPGYPHHVTQRGNRRQKTFFNTEDYQAYLDLVAIAKPRAGCDIWAYCLMPNHVHFVIVPEYEDSLALQFKEAHRRYTRRINFRENWRGQLWQERFHSFVMDEPHLSATARYVDLKCASKHQKTTVRVAQIMQRGDLLNGVFTLTPKV